MPTLESVSTRGALKESQNSLEETDVKDITLMTSLPTALHLPSTQPTPHNHHITDITPLPPHPMTPNHTPGRVMKCRKC